MRTAWTAFLLLLISHLGAYSQAFENPEIVSPEAAALGQYIDVDVSPGTGVPNINVPLYQISHGPIQMPLGLSYFAGGIRVTDISNWIGLGWTLSADMMVTRVVRGVPDEDDDGYFFTGDELFHCSTQTDEDLSFPIHPCLLSDIVNGRKDGEPDIFNYRIPGYTGKFYYGLDSLGNRELRKVNATDLQIEMLYDDIAVEEGERIIGFVIRTPNGLKYTFGTFDAVSAIDKAYHMGSEIFNESWRLMNISTYDDNFQVDFAYDINWYDSYYQTPDRYTRCWQPSGPGTINTTIGGIDRVTKTNRLQSISYENTVISFEANQNRIDVDSTNKMLDEIIITKGAFCKRWVLTHDYYDSGSGAPGIFSKRLRLTKVQEQVCAGRDDSGAIVNPFLFSYNGDFLPDIDSRDSDHWGFYNAADNPDTIFNIPLDTFVHLGDTVILGGADREPNPQVSDTGILVGIQFPTGGTVSYRYENHDYYDVGTSANQLCGGLRIKEIEHFDAEDPTRNTTRRYDYLNSTGSSSGVVFYSNLFVSNTPDYTRSASTNVGPPCGWPCPFQGSVAGNCGTPLIFIAETTTHRPLNSYNGNYIYYTDVREYKSDFSYTDYAYFVPDQPPHPPIITYPQPPNQISLRSGLLKETEIFDTQCTGCGTLQKSVQTYTADYERSPEYFLAVNSFACPYQGSGDCPDAIIFEHTKYPIFSGRLLLTEVESSVDGVVDTTTFAHDPGERFLMPISEEMRNSDGKLHRTEYLYNFDYPNADLKESLLSYNLISTPYQVKKLVAGVQVDGSEVEYRFFSTTTGLPTTATSGSYPRPYKSFRYEKTFDANGSLTGPGKSIQTTLAQYDTDGNIASIQDDGWLARTFLWNSDRTLQSSTFGNQTKSYTYFPNSGMLSSVTDIDSQIIYYRYDKLMRLDTVVARDGNVVSAFDYHYTEVGDPFNYIRQDQQFTSSTGSDVDYLGNVTYVDGLGRETQSVNVQASPDFKDVAVQTTQYDSTRKEVWLYRPNKSTNSDGSYVPSGREYTINKYDELGRLISTTPPFWYETTTEYFRNAHHMTDPEGTVYAPNTLHIHRSTDPDGREFHSVYDKLERLVLQRTILNSDTSDTWTIFDDKNRPQTIYPPGTSTATPDLLFSYLYDASDNVLTLDKPDCTPTEYRYDTRDLQIAMRNPVLVDRQQWLVSQHDDYGRPTQQGYQNTAASTPNGGDSPTIHTLLTEYFYDGFNGVTTASLPINIGKLKKKRVKILDDNSANSLWTETEYFYDSEGRVMTETIDNHLGGSETTMYGYDYMDNMTLFIHNISGSSGINHIQNYTYDHQGRPIDYIVNINGGGPQVIHRLQYNYRNELIERNLGQFATSGDHQFLQSVDYLYNPQGWLTRINDLDYDPVLSPLCPTEDANDQPSETMPLTTDDADLFGLGIQYNGTISGSGVAPNFNGNITALRWWQKPNKTQGYAFEYDSQNRVTSAIHGVFDQTVFDVTNDYYEDFAYDQRGNFTEVNRHGLVANTEGDLQCLHQITIDSLEYVYEMGTNRLIQVLDRAPCPEVLILPETIDRDATFAALNKIIANQTTVNCLANVNLYTPELDIVDTLLLRGECDTIAPIVVSDDSCPQNRYTPGFNQQSLAGQYLYDNAGNMTFDPNKKLTFHYNYLNLPYLVTGNQSDSLFFEYDAEGSTLRRKYVMADSVIWSMEHRMDKEYLNDTLNVVYHSEGRILMKSGGTDHEYWIKDHLGNVRVIFSDDNDDGMLAGDEVRSQHNYYSFGMEQNGIWQQDALEDIREFRYNGKEELTTMGLDVQNYGARWYDPAIARFCNVDPHADRYPSWTPYHYVHNNPIIMVDPDGKDAIVTIKGSTITVSSKIYIYGSGASKSTASLMQTNIMGAWGANPTTGKGWQYTDASSGKTYDVVFDVQVELYNPKDASDEPGFFSGKNNPFNRDNYIEVDNASKRSFVRGGDEGVWRGKGRGGKTLAADDSAPHEFGHLIGFKDRYNKSGAMTGWTGNIMAEPAMKGNVEQKNIDALINPLVKEYNDSWTKWWNPNADYKTSIDYSRMQYEPDQN